MQKKNIVQLFGMFSLVKTLLQTPAPWFFFVSDFKLFDSNDPIPKSLACSLLDCVCMVWTIHLRNEIKFYHLLVVLAC